jgi:hypothetical protein
VRSSFLGKIEERGYVMSDYELAYKGDDVDSRTDYGPLERVIVSSSQTTGWVSVYLVPFVVMKEENIDTRGHFIKINGDKE